MAKKKKTKAVRRRRRRRVLFVFELLILLLLVGGIFVYSQLNQRLGQMQESDLDKSKVEVNEEVVENEEQLSGYQTIALVGLDNRDQSLERGNSDTMIIASINNDTKKIKLVSIYRDTYLNIGNDKYTKANAAYATGGATQLINMLNTNLDLDVEDYVSVNFKAVAETIDLLGGLDITLTEQECVHMNNYCVETSEKTGLSYEPVEPADGTFHLNGVQAVSYARIRYTAGNDFKRASRQRLVIYKMVEAAKNADLSTLNEILDTVFPMVATSLSKADILKMGMIMLTYDLEDQTGFPFDHLEGETITSATGGLDCVLPITLENNVTQLHKFLYPDDDYTPSSTVKEISDHIIETTGYGEDDIPKSSEDGEIPATNY